MNIIKRIPPNQPELVRQLADCSVATVHEALGKIGALDGAICPLDRHMKLCGRAVTVKCHPADNLMLIKAVSMAGPGDVIILDAGDILNAGPFGEVLAVDCQAHGLAGLVTSGSVRDTEAICRRGFPVFCSGISVRGTAKASLGTINQPVSIGGVIVYPGDYILGDADGVVVVPHDRIAEAVETANAREEKERLVMERLSRGEYLFDIYGYQNVLDSLGCSEENQKI
uniref:4-carboxy-4-hydroxy-2-oxoadipate aldolase/oxaloacetate decarboxylase n=1 Tax=Enterocloster clostridioformis TaxID=1531 RepID=UPI0026EFD8B4|nr:4-carboxy-4-hydroxy-2-oxoadipate aldolase/oxaloacetate decarboxylase [Enterocloster clostridioformis]